MRKIHLKVKVELDVTVNADDGVDMETIHDSLTIGVTSPDEGYEVEDFNQIDFQMEVTDSR